ncbi:MAG: S-layer homology domain-containing protein [Acidobacteriota bacterium]
MKGALPLYGVLVRRAAQGLFAAVLLLGSAHIAAAQGANLIVNGGAEAGTGSTLTGWTVVTGTTESISYATGGGFPTAASPGPPVRGANFFAGGCCAVTSQIRQSVDVSSAAAQIDADAVSFQLSGYLGGFSGQDNNAQVTITFLDGSSGTLGSPVTIGPVLAADRNSVTGLLPRTAAGGVPAGTRSVRVDLIQTGDGFYNDGYADNLSLVLVPQDASALDVDRVATPAASDGNGVLEPEETVSVEPSWKNPTGSPESGATGSASGFTGPAGPDYILDDSTAGYGTIGAGAVQGCFSATGDCYQMTVSTGGGARPSTHWDASFLETLTTGDPAKQWSLHVGDSFTDVPRSQPFYKKIETLLHNGITAGCTATAYCPGDPVNRGQMAIFIAKGVAGGGANVPASGLLNGQPYNCAGGGNSLFSDVAPVDIFCRHVHYIAAQNVTLGCATGQYCPGDTVTRLQMASFIAKAIVAPAGGTAVPTNYGPDPVTGLSYSCNAVSPNTHFTDVPASNTFCKHVHFLWAKGIIAGCGATLYCPNDPVTRDAMAKFLSNAFRLVLYGP